MAMIVVANHIVKFKMGIKRVSIKKNFKISIDLDQRRSSGGNSIFRDNGHFKKLMSGPDPVSLAQRS